MKLKIRSWISVFGLMWVSFRVSVLEGVSPVPNPLEVFVKDNKNAEGTKWAILVAGSKGYENYRHQADVCHAYQTLKNGGLSDDNIIVFMYDDIADHPKNPRPGIIINRPGGPNVYQGVPKDYTGNDVNAKNFYAVISGDRSAISGGSGKIVDSGPNDTIFIFLVSHGNIGFVAMPFGDFIIANDFMDVLKNKHTATSYKKMVIYLESCESGSMFQGILPNDIDIYATTAANSTENSYAFYCPDLYPISPPEYTVCLGDAYSISWLEDSDQNDMTKETLQQQYETVRQRTLVGNTNASSHATQFGDSKLNNDVLATYIGAASFPVQNEYSFKPSTTQTRLISQQDAHLLYLRLELQNAPEGSEEKLKAQKEFDDEIAQRERVDNVFHLIWNFLFGEENNSAMMFHVRPSGQPLVDDWDCFKTLIKTYEKHCGTLSSYGRKYSRTFANMCNVGISKEQLKVASLQACLKENHVS